MKRKRDLCRRRPLAARSHPGGPRHRPAPEQSGGAPVGLAARAGHGPRGAPAVGEGQESDGHDSADDTGRDHHPAASAAGHPDVFTQSDGRAYSVDQVGMAVIRAAKQAQLPGVSLHTLRHTFISRLVQAGRPLPEVAALAGHRDIKMTLRYAHLAPSHLRAGIHVLEQRNRDHAARTLIHRNLCHAGVTGIWPEARKCWWSQRDLNPCLSLERAPS